MISEIFTLVGTMFVAITTLIGVLASNNAAKKKTEAIHDEKLKQIKEAIDTLSERQDKHNQVIERTYIVERDVKTAFNQMEEIKTNIREVDAKVNTNTHELNSKCDKINKAIAELKECEIRLEGKIENQQ